MSSLCCCRGLLSMFGVRGYPLDVVAKTKLDKAKMNRAKQNDYSTMSNEGQEQNGTVVRSEPHNNNNLSDASRASSSRNVQRKSSRLKRSSRLSQRPQVIARRRARSFDDSDSDSSNDSEEESQHVIKKNMRKSYHGSRATLASVENESRGSAASARIRDADLELAARHSPRPPVTPPSPHTSPPRKYREDDIEDIQDHEINSSEFLPTGSPPRQRGATIPGTRMRAHDDTSAFPFDDDNVASNEGTPHNGRKTMGSTREFHRKAMRKVSPKSSPSMSRRSQRSVSPSYSSAKWEMEEAGSIYREAQLSSTFRGSEEDELAMAKNAAESATRSIDDSDEELHVQGLEPISSCGTLDVAVQYYLSERKLQVTIIEAHDLPSKARGGASIVQVRAVLLPEKKKKYKTKVQHIGSPRFAETFKLTRASPDELKGLALRLRMYGIGKLKDRLIGEAVIRFDELNLIRDPQLTIQLQLEPRTDINRGESMSSLSNIDSRASSMMSLSHGGNPPEILIGLSYNAPTGRLCVEVIKGSHFRNLAMAKPPDTFVKLSLLNSACQEMSQSKTTIRRGQPNPVYKETFFFQVALFQLGEVTLMVSVYNKRTIKKKEMIGWVSMGRNSSSEIDEQHWQEMKEGKGQQVCRWHALIDT